MASVNQVVGAEQPVVWSATNITAFASQTAWYPITHITYFGDVYNNALNPFPLQANLEQIPNWFRYNYLYIVNNDLTTSIHVRLDNSLNIFATVPAGGTLELTPETCPPYKYIQLMSPDANLASGSVFIYGRRI